MLQAGRSSLRLRLLQAELFYFAGTMPLHRFSISSPDLRIDVAKKVKTGAILPSQGSEALCGNTAPCPQAESAAEQKQLAAAQPLAEGYDEIAENGHAYY